MKGLVYETFLVGFTVALSVAMDEFGINAENPYDCAFCGEENSVFVDGSGARVQQFTEDCTVCCRPNLLKITIERDDSVWIDVEREYDA